MKKKSSPGVELPIAADYPLPYLKVYKSFFPKVAVIPVLTMMLAVAGLALSPQLGLWRPSFMVLEMLSIISIVVITSRSLKRRKKAWDALHSDIDVFIETVKIRYGVVLTETILYVIAQGGDTLLSDKNGQLTRLTVESDSETRTTKLVVAGKP